MPYRLRKDVLRTAAAKAGDKSLSSIIATTKLADSVVHRALGGYNEPSLGTLMRFSACYGISVNDLVQEIEAEAPLALAS